MTSNIVHFLYTKMILPVRVDFCLKQLLTFAVDGYLRHFYLFYFQRHVIDNNRPLLYISLTKELLYIDLMVKFAVECKRLQIFVKSLIVVRYFDVKFSYVFIFAL